MLGKRVRALGQFDALVLTALLWFLGKFVRYAFPPLFETFSQSYGVSRTVLGTAVTGLMLVYAAMQFPSGVLADRLGAVRVITAGTLLTALAALAIVVDAPFIVLAGAMVAAGAGTGTYKTVAVRLLARAYPTRTGRVLGVFDTFGSAGGVAAPAAVVLGAGLPPVLGAPWRTLFLATGLAAIGLAVAFATRVPGRLSLATGTVESSSRTDGDSTPSSLRTYLRLFQRPRFAGFVAVTVLFGFAFNGTVAFLPLYLASETALTAVTANLLFSALFVAGLVQLVTGEASDRVGTVPVLVLTLAVATAGLVAIIALSDAGGPLALGAAVVTLGLGSHGFRPVRGAYLMEIVPDAVAGGSFGIVRTMLMGAGAVAPAVVGYVSETAGFRTSFEVLGAALLGATGLMLGLWIATR
jgi:MFS family permease